MAELIPEGDADDITPSCPPEYAHLSGPELIAAIEGERRRRAAAAAGEILAAGFRDRTPSSPSRAGTGFESGGSRDVGAPSGSLVGLTESASRDGRLAGLDDDELIGVLRAWQRLGSWCASGLLKAIAELARRRPADRTPAAPSGEFPAQLSEFLGDEIAAALTLTARAADTQLSLSLDLEIRLPGTAQALPEGVITNAKAQLIAEATRILSDDDASAVEARILSRAGQQTTGQLRAAVARAVLAIDPAADVLAADQRITARAGRCVTRACPVRWRNSALAPTWTRCSARTPPHPWNQTSHPHPGRPTAVALAVARQAHRCCLDPAAGGWRGGANRRV